jgi:hypothetical protein
VHGARVFFQAVGSQAELIRALLAAGIEHGSTPRLEACRGLKQQRGLADARLAADEGHGAGDDAAAQHEIELVHPGAETRDGFGGDITQAGGRCCLGRAVARATPARPRSTSGRAPHGDRLLGHRVPLAAALAAAGPLRVLVPALGAAIDRPRTGHATRAPRER